VVEALGAMGSSGQEKGPEARSPGRTASLQ